MELLDSKKTEDSLKKRYVYKLSSNIIGLFINMVIQAIIPRGLGPKAYGDFSFLTNFFNQIIGFLDMGTSFGFYTKLSQRQKEFGLVSFYLKFAGIVSLLTIGLVLISHSTSAYKKFWPDQELLFIYMAAGWGILTWIVRLLNQMTDAYGLTTYSEIARIIQKVLGVIIILLLFIFHQLNLTHFFYYNYLILFFLCVAFIWVMEHNKYSMRQEWRIPLVKIKGYFKEFYQYSHPLFIYVLIGLIVSIFDRWLLQYFSGSVQQGFFGLSYQIGIICFLFTSAMTPLLMREFSISFGKGDLERMAVLFQRYIPILYSIAAYLSCFIALQAEEVTTLIGGIKFKDAVLAVTIMAFFPIHQTFGQLTGSIVWATGKTRLKRNIDGSFALLGIPLTFFLIAPREYYGFDLGATGLAIKMVFLQIITVNVRFFFVSKIIRINALKYYFYQFYVLISFLALSSISAFIIKTLIHGSSIFVISLSFSFYSLISFSVLIIFPKAFGLNRADLNYLKNMIFKQKR